MNVYMKHVDEEHSNWFAKVKDSDELENLMSFLRDKGVYCYCDSELSRNIEFQVVRSNDDNFIEIIVYPE